MAAINIYIYIYRLFFGGSGMYIYIYIYIYVPRTYSMILSLQNGRVNPLQNDLFVVDSAGCPTSWREGAGEYMSVHI